MGQAQFGQDDNGNVFADVTIDGHPARIYSQQKFLHAHSLVYLGDDWEKRLPVIELPADSSDGRGPLPLSGFTRDPNVVALARRVVQIANSDEPLPRTAPAAMSA